MKKNLLYFIFASLFLTGFFTGCYEDKSTTGEVKATVVIDTAGWNLPGNMLTAVNGSMLVLDPTVTQAGVAQPDLSYKWEITVTAGSQETILSEIGTERRLEKLVNWTPNNQFYTLVFTVRDNRTGVCYIHQYKVTVVSAMGDGVIVGDTRDGGATSDLTLVRNKYVSAGYTADAVYRRNYYSLNNGAGIPGAVKKILYYPLGGTYGDKQFKIYMMSDRTLQRLDAGTYRINDRFEDLFLLPPDPNEAYQTIAAQPQQLLFVYGNDVYRMMNMGVTETQFGDPLTYVSPADADKKYTANEYVLVEGGNWYLFDQPKGRMAVCQWLSGKKPEPVYQGAVPNAYDPDALDGYVQMGSCYQPEGVDKGVYHILKAPDGQVGFYEAGASQNNDIEYNQTGIRLTTASCPEIGDALFFDGCKTRPVVYYATRTRVYAGVVGQTNINAPSYFEAPAGEEITCMQVFRDPQPDYLQGSELALLPAHENLLMVATCNGAGEGKVYLLPISGNSGTLGTPAADQILTGFGRITALGVQGKQ